MLRAWGQRLWYFNIFMWGFKQCARGVWWKFWVIHCALMHLNQTNLLAFYGTASFKKFYVVPLYKLSYLVKVLWWPLKILLKLFSNYPGTFNSYLLTMNIISFFICKAIFSCGVFNCFVILKCIHLSWQILHNIYDFCCFYKFYSVILSVSRDLQEPIYVKF